LERAVTEDPEGGAQIQQISVYLLRDDRSTFEGALRDPDGVVAYDLDPSSGFDGRLFVLPSDSRAPSWLPFLESITAEALPAYANQHVSAVLIVRRGGRLYALTFGFGRFLLDPDMIEPDFGLKVAAGLVDPDQINSVDSRILEATRVQVRRQASRGTTTQTIGVEIAREMLRALSGRTLDDAHGTRIHGADSIALAGKFDPSAVRDRIDLFTQAYSDKLYQRRFPHIDRWQAVTDRREISRLDQKLLEAVEGKDPKLDLGVPEIVEWRASGFRFSQEPETVLHALPDLATYRASRSGSPSLADLRRDRLILASGEIETPSTSWPVYRAIEWETLLDSHVYVLADGSWWRIDADYLRRVDDRLAQIRSDPLEAPDADPREWEPDYTARLAAFRPDRVVLDQKLARFQDEAGTVEYCDVFSASRQFIHLKPDSSATGLSHLFGQGVVSADLFRHSAAFRRNLRDFLRDALTRPDLADTVPVDRPGPGDFEVIFGLLTDDPTRVATNLPVFSRIHLARMADLIERLDYRLRVVGIARVAGARSPEWGETIGEKRAREKAAAAGMATT
jgi:uncharacterized protein (TIGR04141 family)